MTLKRFHVPKMALGSDDALNIIIVGCGKVGTTLVEQLTAEGNLVTLIDHNAQKVNDISSTYDILGIVGNGASYNIQKEAGIDNADLIIAVTDSDELNLLCCTVARRVGKCAAIARVRTPDYSSEIPYLQDKLELAMIINPEMEAALEISRIISLPSALEVDSFVHSMAELIKFKIEQFSPLISKSVAQMAMSVKENFIFAAVERDKTIYIPKGDFVFKEGDLVSIVASRSRRKYCLKSVGVDTSSVHTCIIAGGGKSAYYLASDLIHQGISVKIIEKDYKRCENLSVLLPKATILNADATDTDLMKEEGIEKVDAFVPLTGLDEVNMILSLHAKSCSKAKIITKLNRFSFENVVDSLDLGSIVFPRLITAEAIIAYVRAMRATIDSNLETLIHIYGGRAEAVEFKISSSAPVLNQPISQLELKDDVILASINRRGRLIFPKGNDIIEVGDLLLIVTTQKGFKDVGDILK